MITESALQAQSILRDSSHFSWNVIPMLIIVFYIYFQEAERGNWGQNISGVSFLGNGLV